MASKHPVLSKRKPLQEDAVGVVTIQKSFWDDSSQRTRLYLGIVKQYYPEDNEYLIEYEDGDKEDMKWAAICKHSPALTGCKRGPGSGMTGGRASKIHRADRAEDTAAAAAAAEAAAVNHEQRPGQHLQGQQHHHQQQSRGRRHTSSQAAAPGAADGGRSVPRKRHKAVASSNPAATTTTNGAAAAAGTSNPAPSAATEDHIGAELPSGCAAAPAAAEPAAKAASKPKRTRSKAPGSQSAKLPAGPARHGTQAKARQQTGAPAADKGPGSVAAAAAAPAGAAGGAAPADGTPAPAAAGKQRQQKQQPQQEACAGKPQRKPVAPRPPRVKVLPDYGPARVLEAAAREYSAKQVAQLMNVRRAAQAAAGMLRCKDLVKDCTDGNRPLWEIEPEELPEAFTGEDAHKLLTKQARPAFEVGKEPWRAFVLMPHLMEKLLAADVEPQQAVAAVAADLAPVWKEPPAPKERTDAAPDGAAGAAAPKGSSKAKAGKENSAGAAATATAAGGSGKGSKAKAGTGAAAAAGVGDSGKGSKAKAGKENSAAAAAAAAGVGDSSKGSKSKAGKGAAAAAGAGDDGKGSSGKGSKASAAAGDAAQLVEHRYPVLSVCYQEHSDPSGDLAVAVRTVIQDYNKEFRPAVLSEDDRVALMQQANAEAKAKGLPAPHKNPSRRPDRVAESKMVRSNRIVNAGPLWGYIPGVPANQKMELRSVASILGLHKSPMAGMVAAPLPVPIMIDGELRVGGKVQAVTSIVMAGLYSPDKDGHHADASSCVIMYTGMGGNDLLGNKSQVQDQKLKGVNRHMLVNLALGLPLRVLRRNDDPDSATGTSLTYDGLWEVVSVARCWVSRAQAEKAAKEEQQDEGEGAGSAEGADAEQDGRRKQSTSQPKKKSSSKAEKDSTKQQVKQKQKTKKADKQQDQYVLTFVYGLRRLPGQAESASKPIPHWKGAASAKAKVCIDRRPNAICRDLSKGTEEPAVVVAVNEINRELPPGLDPKEHASLLLDSTQGRFIKAPSTLTYIRDNVYDRNLPRPQPPKLVTVGSVEGKAEEKRLRDAAAAGSLSGCGPYVDGPLWDKSVVIQTREEAQDSEHGPHRLLARLNGGVLPYRELRSDAKTKVQAPVVSGVFRVLVECGPWTGCTDSHCPQRQAHRPLQFRLEVFRTQHMGWAVQSWDPIPAGALVTVMRGLIMRAQDVGRGTSYGHSEYLFELCPRPDVDYRGREVKQPLYADPKNVLCARDQGNVARFINHSCDPNLYVQPMCAGHTDTDHVYIALVAARNISAFEPLSYDYGEVYVEHNLDGVCHCGVACCKSRKQPAAGPAAAGAATAAGRGTGTVDGSDAV